MFLKKGILGLLLIVSSQVFGLGSAKGSVSVFAELLYWQISEVGADNWAQVISPAAANQSIQFLTVPFKWDPGFRVGAAYQTEDRLWDSVIYYTWYHTQGTAAAEVNTGEIHSPNSGNFYANNVQGNGLSGPFYHKAAINWNILFNNLDWEVGRIFNINNRYSFRPFVGLKAAVINQDIKTDWQTPFDPAFKLPITSFSSASENITNNFRGVGPSFGLNMLWNMYESPKGTLSLFGNFSGAFLWGNWHITNVYENNTPVTITIQNNVRSSTSTMTKGRIGLNWQNTIQNKELMVHLGYEGQVWLNQLRFYSFDGGRQNNTLYIHGAVLDVCIHF